MLCYAMLCYAMLWLCYAMAMLCYAMLCYAMLCYAAGMVRTQPAHLYRAIASDISAMVSNVHIIMVMVASSNHIAS